MCVSAHSQSKRAVLSPSPTPLRVESAAATRAHGRPIAGLHLAALAAADSAHSTVQQLQLKVATASRKPVTESPYARPATTEPSPRRMLATLAAADGKPDPIVTATLMSPVRYNALC